MAVRNKQRNRLKRIIQRRIGLRPGERYTGAEIQAMERGVPPQLIAKRRKIERTMEKNPDWARNLRENLEIGKEYDIKHTWKINRTYRHYDFAFSRALKRFSGKSMLDTIVEIAPRNRALRILDDGAGEGNFLAGIKKRLRGKGVKVETTALSLGKNKKLAEKEARGEINHVIEKPAEFFLPEGQFDVITSVAGSIEYAGMKTQADHLLKVCHSLRKGGIALIGFEIQKYIWTQRHYSSEELEKIKERVKKRLRKEGFEAKFYDRDKLYPPEDYINRKNVWTMFDQTPPDILIIRRER